MLKLLDSYHHQTELVFYRYEFVFISALKKNSHYQKSQRPDLGGNSLSIRYVLKGYVDNERDATVVNLSTIWHGTTGVNRFK